jgi:choline-sulfatase
MKARHISPRKSPPKTPPQRGPRRLPPILPIAVALATVGALCWLGLRAKHAPAAPKLNLLLITLDTTRADHLGCYGDTAARTPNLDQLARDGVRFAECACSCPLTLPSHTSLMTGVNPYVHGARWNGTSYVSAANQTLAETLQAAGYRTRAAIASFVLNRQFGLSQGFEVYHDVVPPSAGAALEAERRGDAVCNDAIDLLQSFKGERFFLWVHFYDPHLPYVSQQHTDPTSPEAYADEITYMDEHVGRLLGELQRLKLDTNTLVVAVGDHGEGLGQHDEPTHGFFLYESTLHVPLIFRGPGVGTAGQAVATPVRIIDIAPTILALLGGPELPNIEGTSLLPLLRGQKLQSPLPAYAETFEANMQFGLSPLRSLRQDRWKFILAPAPELYDLADDPNETNNLASAQPDLVARFPQEVRALIAEAPPPVQRDAQAGLTGEDMKRLQSLGYVGAAATMPADLQSELESVAPRGGNPRDYGKLFQLSARAREATAKGRFPAAESLYRQMIEALPAAPQHYAGLADALRGQQRVPEALDAVQAALARSPDDIHIRATYGSLLSDAGRWPEAAEQFQTVLRQSPRDTIVLHNMGVALAFLGRLDEAEQHFQLGLSIQADSPCLLQAMGVLRSRQGRLTEAVTYLKKALLIDPEFKQAAQDLQDEERSRRR